jgi:hypothetical protein
LATFFSNVFTLQVEVCMRTVSFELLIVDHNPFQSRVVFDDKTYGLHLFPDRLGVVVPNAFKELDRGGVSSVNVVSSLVFGTRNMADIALLSDETLFWVAGEAYSLPWYTKLHGGELPQSLKLAISLLTWLWSSHFEHVDCSSSRQSCIVCGNARIRDQSYLRPNMSSGEEFGWPLLCSDADCFSHTIGEAIHSDYQRPANKSGIARTALKGVPGLIVRGG